MNGIGTQPLETPRLRLRRLKVEDAAAMYANWASDPMVSRYLTWDAHTSPEVTKEYLESKPALYEKPFYFEWGVELKETGELIGSIAGVNVGAKDRLVEVGYCYGRAYWGKGYGPETLQVVLGFLFEQVEAEIVVACHIGTNPNSGRVMHKAGMHRDAALPQYLVDKTTGKREDQVWYSLRREEWQGR